MYLMRSPLDVVTGHLVMKQKATDGAHLPSPETKVTTLAHIVTAAKLKALPRRRAFRTVLWDANNEIPAAFGHRRLGQGGGGHRRRLILREAARTNLKTVRKRDIIKII